MRPGRQKIIFMVGGFLIGFLNPVLASNPSASLRVEASPQDITIGDVVSYTATLSYSTGAKPIPFMPPDSFAPFEILNIKSDEPISNEDGSQTLTHHLAVTTWSTGTQTIPSLAFSFNTQTSTTPIHVKTEPIDINVQSILDKYGDIGGLKPPKPFFGFRSYLWIWILLGVLAFFGIGYLLFRWSKKQRENAFGPTGPPKPPEEIAWDQISQLERSNLLEEGQFKEFYSQIAQIFRTYLENRYEISALDRTTSEIMIEIRKAQLSSDSVSITRQVLEMGDLVKFAKLEPKETEAEDDLNRLKKFIQMTTPQPAEPEGSKEELPI